MKTAPASPSGKAPITAAKGFGGSGSEFKTVYASKAAPDSPSGKGADDCNQKGLGCQMVDITKAAPVPSSVKAQMTAAQGVRGSLLQSVSGHAPKTRHCCGRQRLQWYVSPCSCCCLCRQHAGSTVTTDRLHTCCARPGQPAAEASQTDGGTSGCSHNVRPSPTVSLSSLKARKAFTADASASSSEGGPACLRRCDTMPDASRGPSYSVGVSAPPSLKICSAMQAVNADEEGCWLLPSRYHAADGGARDDT
jgi:hypothetical protein